MEFALIQQIKHTVFFSSCLAPASSLCADLSCWSGGARAHGDNPITTPFSVGSTRLAVNLSIILGDLQRELFR
jgi:hypothetical protein